MAFFLHVNLSIPYVKRNIHCDSCNSGRLGCHQLFDLAKKRSVPLAWNIGAFPKNTQKDCRLLTCLQQCSPRIKLSMTPIYSLLEKIERPSRYLGNEVNVIRKDFDQMEIKVCLVFPDKYEMGMSHVGLKILYEILNRLPHVVAERCFAPDLDLEDALRQKKIPLFSLESKKPLSAFDIIGFSLTYELTYVNMINILDLAQIPVWQKERTDDHPLIIAGGGCTMNAEPVADFLDAACLGDGEEIVLDVIKTVQKKHDSRSLLLHALSEIEGIYVPSFFQPEYNSDGTLQAVTPLKPGYEKINKRTLKEIDSAVFPTRLLVPSIKTIHDRIGIEIQRGCNRACRFCQAGYIDRPVRQRSPETILKIAEESYRQTGIDEISLLSLSAADYACLVPLLSELNQRYADKRVSLSVPATRTEKMTPDLIEQIKKVRRTGFTIAPEAGSERMRRVINKGNKVEDLHVAVKNAFSAGWQLLKMYYMVGLPFENDDDVLGIADESRQCHQIARGFSPRAELNTSVSSFVPKPHTPFQWEPQMTIEETERKYALVRRNLGDRRIHFKHHHSQMSYLEGILSRGDRRVSQLLYFAFQEGCRFDEWEEHFDFAKWSQAIEKWGVDPAFYLHRKRNREEVLPWDHLFAQMDKEFLWEEYEKAQREAFTEDCSVARCSDCGVCDFREVKNRIYVVDEKPVVVKKGNREAYGWTSVGANLVFAQPDRRSQGPRGAGSPLPLFKIRARYSKTGDARFMGHLELIQVMKRTITRAGFPVRYSEGFHPQMKLAMGPPLSLGIESEWEYFDLELISPLEPDFFSQQLNERLPHGVKILVSERVDRKIPSIYSSITSMDYKIWSEKGNLEPFRDVLHGFVGGENRMWRRISDQKEKIFSLKDHVQTDLEHFPDELVVSIRQSQEGSLKPQEVVKAFLEKEPRELEGIRFLKIGLSFGVQAGMSG